MQKLALILFAVVAPLVVSAQEISKPRLTVLVNGLRVVTVEDHTNPLVSAVWSVHVGASLDPPELSGMAHFVEHLISARGTEKFPGNSIPALVSQKGGFFDATTWYDATTYEIVLHSRELETILEIHEQMMFRAKLAVTDFETTDFETEREAVFEEIRADEDLPHQYLVNAAPSRIYPADTFYSRSTIGTIEKVRAITREHVRRYYLNYYAPNNITLVLVGDFDTEKLLTSIASRFGRYKRKILPANIHDVISFKPGVTVVAEERDVAKAYFLAAFEGPSARSPDFVPLELLLTYLGDGRPTSLLHETLVRTQALLEGVRAMPERRRWGSGWQPFTGEGEPNKIAAGIDGLLSELARVRIGGISRERLALTKTRIINAHRLAVENRLTYATLLALGDALGHFELLSELEKHVASVTPEDIQIVAKKYLGPNRFFLMALFPKGETPQRFVADVMRSARRWGRLPDSRVVSRSLHDGVTLIHELRPGSKVSSITVAVKAGAGNDGALSGLSDATATMMRQRTRKRSRQQLQSYLDREGVVLSGETDEDGTTFSFVSPSANVDLIARLVREILSEPLFAPSSWNLERRLLIAKARLNMDRPQVVAERELLAQFYPHTSLGTRLGDRMKSLEQITTTDLVEFYRRHYRPERIAIAYVGPVSRDSVAALFSNRSAYNPSSPMPAVETPRRISLDGVRRATIPMPGKRQVHLIWGWPGPSTTDDDWVLWLLAQKVFGEVETSRLWHLRQNEGLAYEVWCDSYEIGDQPIVMIYLAYAREKHAQVVKALAREIKKIREGGLSRDELEWAKVSLITSLERTDQTAQQRSLQIASSWLRGFGIGRRAHLRRVISQATLSSVNRVIRETLSLDRLVQVEVGAVASD
ncbi:MAG: M16 family metallopeptidase [Hyphomicrobiaceae bacterium]